MVSVHDLFYHALGVRSQWDKPSVTIRTPLPGVSLRAPFYFDAHAVLMVIVWAVTCVLWRPLKGLTNLSGEKAVL